MPAAFTSTNPVTVGSATKKPHYDAVFDNTLALKQGDVARNQERLAAIATPALSNAGDAVVHFNSTRKLLEASLNGGRYRAIGDATADPLFVALCY